MPDKKYKFADILKEYNKKYKTNLELKHYIIKAIITYFCKDGTFDVEFTQANMKVPHEQSLENFIYYHVYPNNSNSFNNIKALILQKQETMLDIKIKILPPSQIRYAYLQANYYSGAGVLGKSCMRYKENQKALNFYVKNNVRIVVAIDSNHKIHARALLWNNVKSIKRKTSFTYLDRIYIKSEHILPQFHKLAKKHKWKCYNQNDRSYYYKDNIDVTDICHFPYTDTFRKLYYKDGVITSDCKPSKLKHSDDYISLTRTDNGGYFQNLDPNSIKEALSNIWVSKKDAVKVKRYNGWVLKKNIVDIKGDYYSTLDKSIIKSPLDGYIFKENLVNEVITDAAIDKTQAIESVKYKGYIHKFSVVNIKDEIYHKKDENVICFNKKWYHISDCFRSYDRKNRNIELSSKQFHFWIPDEVFVPSPKNTVKYKDNLIPKNHAIIAYNLNYSPVLDDIEYQEVYCTDKIGFEGLIKLSTGEFIVDSSENRQHLKKFNNKWYIKKDFKPPNKNQLKFVYK